MSNHLRIRHAEHIMDDSECRRAQRRNQRNPSIGVPNVSPAIVARQKPGEGVLAVHEAGIDRGKGAAGAQFAQDIADKRRYLGVR